VSALRNLCVNCIKKEDLILTRRELLVKSASLAAAIPAAKLVSALPPARQLRSIGIRFEVPAADAAKTFQALEAIGYREMEEPFKDIEEALSAVQATSLKKICAYIEGSLTFPGKEDELSRTLEKVKKWGFQYASCSYRKIEGAKGPERFRIFAERMNKAGEKCRAAGLGPFLYHEQLPELVTVDGTSGYELLLNEQDQNLCGLELDVYWVSLSGKDPVALLQKLAGRVKIIHLKDKPAGLPPMTQRTSGSSEMLDVGAGSMDWPAILRAATLSGVQHYIVEPRSDDLLIHALKSFDYLSKLEY
jgi:hypothetical protein